MPCHFQRRKMFNQFLCSCFAAGKKLHAWLSLPDILPQQIRQTLENHQRNANMSLRSFLFVDKISAWEHSLSDRLIVREEGEQGSCWYSKLEGLLGLDRLLGIKNRLKVLLSVCLLIDWMTFSDSWQAISIIFQWLFFFPCCTSFFLLCLYNKAIWGIWLTQWVTRAFLSHILYPITYFGWRLRMVTLTNDYIDTSSFKHFPLFLSGNKLPYIHWLHKLFLQSEGEKPDSICNKNRLVFYIVYFQTIYPRTSRSK